MTRFALLFVLVACKGKDKPPAAAATGSAGSAVVADATDVAALDAAVGSGSAAEGSATAGSGSAAPTSTAGKIVITTEGIGPLQRFNWSKQNEKATAALIQKTLKPVLPGIQTSVAVVTAGAKKEKKSYWAVKRDGKEIVQVLRSGGGADSPAEPAVMIAYTPEVTTADGTKVGDTVADLMAKHADLKCYNDPDEPISGTIRADVVCHDKTQMGLLYVIDTAGRKLPLTPLVITDPKAPDHLDLKTISDLKISAIVGIPR